jgi:hypothetical protein
MPNSQTTTGVVPGPKGLHLMCQWCYQEAGQNYLEYSVCIMLVSFRLCIFPPSWPHYQPTDCQASSAPVKVPTAPKRYLQNPRDWSWHSWHLLCGIAATICLSMSRPSRIIPTMVQLSLHNSQFLRLTLWLLTMPANPTRTLKVHR